MRTLVLAASLAASLALPAGATTLLDFDTQNGGAAGSAGPITGNEYTDFGVTISVSGGTSQLALFNSNCGPDFPGAPCTGGDTDLASGPSFGTPAQGLVLIGQEPGLGEPGDLAGTYTFRFDFAPRAFLSTVTMLDLDEGEFNSGANNLQFARFFADGTSVSSFSPDLTATTIGSGDNSLSTFTFNEANVTRLDIAFDGISGSVAAVEFTPVPLPAGAVLVLTGLGALGVMRRRRTA